MKAANKITLCAVMASLATVIMLVSYFPYLTYAVPAVAGLFVMVVVIEIDCKWAFLSYLSSAFLTFLFAEPESKLMFIGFFGFYPIIKCLIEKLNRPVFEWILKFLVFNVCVITVYKLIARLLGVSFDDMNHIIKYGELILLGMGNFVFVFYDIAVSRLAGLYSEKLHFRISRMLKR